MEYFYSDDPQEIEKEKKKQECYRHYLPLLMGDKDETVYVLLDKNDNEDKPTDKAISKNLEVRNKVRVLAKEVGFAIRNPREAWKIGPGVMHNSTNISTKATRFATRGKLLYGTKDGEEELGSENGAFRHTLWQAEIASKFGERVAISAGNAHEIDPNTNLNNRRFNYIGNADQTTDLLNNQVGRRIGMQNPNKNTKDLAFRVLDEFRENGLYVTEQDEQGVFNVKKKKLSEERYDSLKNIYNTLNKDGFTLKEVSDIEKEINKDGRTFKGTDTRWRTIR